MLVRTPTAPQLGPFPASCTDCSVPGPSVTSPGSLVVHSPLVFQHLFSCRSFGIPSNSRVSPLHQSCTAGLSTRLLPALHLLTPIRLQVDQHFSRLQVFQRPFQLPVFHHPFRLQSSNSSSGSRSSKMGSLL